MGSGTGKRGIKRWKRLCTGRDGFNDDCSGVEPWRGGGFEILQMGGLVLYEVRVAWLAHFHNVIRTGCMLRIVRILSEFTHSPQNSVGQLVASEWKSEMQLAVTRAPF